MNASDRKAIAKLGEEIAALWSKLDDCKSELETLKDDEQEKFDNMSDGLQQGERGQAIEEAAGQLSEAFDALETAVSSAEECVGMLNNLSGG